MILGVIADDFTGATDVASMLVRAGMRTVQVIGVPDGIPPDADAVVVALKSRTAPVTTAVEESMTALKWLKSGGARQFYFKYCSTFDSTPTGNIGPVTEALMEALDTRFTIACPAFPENGRTVFRGHLFVGDELLSDSGMQNHPLTPMTDSNLVRVLQSQCRSQIGLARYDVVNQGVDKLMQRFYELKAQGVGITIVDAVDNDALRTMAAACSGLPLLTAGSGLALGLPAVYEANGWIRPDAKASELPSVGGCAAVLSGSCSVATNGQVEHWIKLGLPSLRIDARALAAGENLVEQALDWVAVQGDRPILIYATAQPSEVKSIQADLGAEAAGALVENCLATIASGLVKTGVRRLVAAGGETSGAIVKALNVQQLRIGATIDPGVPWTQVEGRPLLLALKSGNFGTIDFFSKALHLAS